MYKGKERGKKEKEKGYSGTHLTTTKSVAMIDKRSNPY